MPMTTPVLLRGLVDDAAVFPPGNAPLAEAVAGHAVHRAAGYAGCIGPLLVPAAVVADLVSVLDARDAGATETATAASLDLVLVARPGADPATTTAALEALRDEARVRVVGAELAWREGWRDLGLDDVPIALEVPRGAEQVLAVAEVHRAVSDGQRVVAKFRTGPTPTWPWPDEAELGDFLAATSALTVPFKLTGGLHHAARGTYEVGGEPEENHGVLNVLLATSAALSGAGRDELVALLALRDAVALADVVAAWPDATSSRVREAFTAYGCCTVTDPLGELAGLGLLDAPSTAHRPPHQRHPRDAPPRPHLDRRTAMTWLDLPPDHPFGVHNLPYGVFSTADGRRRVGVRVGDHVLDLAACAEHAGMESAVVWRGPSLNPFLDEGREAWAAARAWLTEQLTDEAHRDAVEPHLVPLADVTMHLPVEVADYVDFYASEHHATNVGRLFRPDSEPLTPNWKHLPIGYHGRSGTIVVSGTDVVRPSGQRKPPTEPAPVFGPSGRLDIEAELGFVVGSGTRLGEPVALGDADEHLFGVVLLNDWSARDLQAWEYVPLGPFLGKSFATSISPWVVTTDALRAARVPLPGQDPQPLPYLSGEPTADGAGTAYGLDVHVEVDWNGTVVSRPQFRDMYWSPAQMVAHMTVNGATLRSGDLFGSGTVSGPEKGTRGCFLELTWGGTEPVALDDGSQRTFLEDGDTVTLRATAPGPDGSVIGLGECVGTVVPAR